MRRIEVELSPTSIDLAVNHLYEIADRLEDFADGLAEGLADHGKTIAEQNVSVYTGELMGNIKVIKQDEGRYQLEANSPHAAFHEFGTGVVGQGTYSHPFPVPWKYNAGWKRNTRFDASDPDKWFYFEGGEWHSTRGQRGHAYMAQAAEAMRQNIIPLAKAGFYL